jgi:hypothetical protein
MQIGQIWQLPTWGMAQAGNRAGKTERQLQWSENKSEQACSILSCGEQVRQDLFCPSPTKIEPTTTTIPKTTRTTRRARKTRKIRTTTRKRRTTTTTKTTITTTTTSI